MLLAEISVFASATPCLLHNSLRAVAMAAVGDGALAASEGLSEQGGDKEVLEIIRRVENEEMGIVQASARLEEELRKRDLVYEATISPRQVGFDPVNRDGEGGNAQEVLLLATDIACVGWSWQETRHAMCVEILPGDLAVEKFNRQLCDGVGLAPVEPHSIRFGSLSCGHTNMALRAIEASMPSECSFLSEGGRFSLRKLELRDQEFANAVRQGLRWLVLRSEVRVRFPDVLRIFQAAKNVTGHVARQANEMQGLVQLHSMSAAMQAQGCIIDWPRIRRAVLRARPPFGDSVDSMIAFIATRSGGTDGAFLKYLAACYRQYVNPSVRKCLPPAMYSALADFPLHYVALAIWQAAYTCPLDSVRQGVCGWITTQEVVGLARAFKGEKKQMLELSEQVLSQARTELPKTGFKDDIVSSNLLVGLFTKLDANMARYVLSKQNSSKRVFETAPAIGLNFAREYLALFPSADISVYRGLWDEASTAEGASTAEEVVKQGEGASGPSIELYKVGVAGKTESVRAKLRNKGFDIGTVVVETAKLEALGPSTTCWRVDAIRDEKSEVVLLRDRLSIAYRYYH